MTHKLAHPAKAAGPVPKGTVADHWTWRDGVPVVTGYHRKPTRGQQQVELVPAPVSVRGLVSTSGGRRRSEAKERQGSLL